ncbi:Testicular Acid Phosphatase [Manis pentadactyla]|nr:Testicular Acid Phosphatase [Manis pentadactyla]
MKKVESLRSPREPQHLRGPPLDGASSCCCSSPDGSSLVFVAVVRCPPSSLAPHGPQASPDMVLSLALQLTSDPGCVAQPALAPHQCCAARPGRPWTRDKSPAFLPTEALSHPQLLREATEATEYKAGLKGWRVWVPGRHRAGRRDVATVAVGGADGEEPRVEVGHDFPTWGENFTSPSLVWEPLRRAGKVLDTLMRQVRGYMLAIPPMQFRYRKSARNRNLGSRS